MQPHRGALVLVLGILGIVFCQLCAPVAWLMGKKDLQQMDAGQMDPEGKGMTQAGMYMGMVGTVLIVLGLIGFVLFLVLFGMTASSSLEL